ncbi:MAG: hypothetical protein M3Q33_01400 [Acidobacteriota bacterium]|nr:hypothetical protein [Acidobacteriota bacterium]
MPKLKFFTAPKDYSDYSFWRMCHHEKALFVMMCALAWLIASWLAPYLW